MYLYWPRNVFKSMFYFQTLTAVPPGSFSALRAPDLKHCTGADRLTF